MKPPIDKSEEWPSELEALNWEPSSHEGRARGASLEAFGRYQRNHKRRNSKKFIVPFTLAAALVLTFWLGFVVSKATSQSNTQQDLATLLHNGELLFGSELVGLSINSNQSRSVPNWHLIPQGKNAIISPHRQATPYRLAITAGDGTETIVVVRPGYPVKVGGYQLELLENTGGIPLIVGNGFLWQGGKTIGLGPTITAKPEPIAL